MPADTPTTIATVADFDAAIAAPIAVFHFDVDWSTDAVSARPTVLQFKNALARNASANGVALFRIDCTRQDGELWDRVKKWFEDQRADDSVMSQGCGAIVWVSHGRIVDSVISAKTTGANGLIRRTAKAFKLNL